VQKFTQKYTLIQLLEDMPESTEYDWKDWPLHVTVADIFAIDWDISTLIDKLSQLLKQHTQATAVAADDARLGSARVVLLHASSELMKLHDDIVTLLEQGGVTFNNPQFIKEGFLPHSTIQKQARLIKGDLITFNALSIVDMFPSGDPYRRKIIKTIKIGGI
jgi:2'-5' RNA ligase